MLQNTKGTTRKNDLILTEEIYIADECYLPSFFNHFTMFPSSIVGESAGMRTLIPGVPVTQAHDYLD